MKKIYIGLLIISISIKSNAQFAILIGPMLHWNLNDYREFNWGLEVSCWNFTNNGINWTNPKGFDFGFESAEGIFRIYTEIQAASNNDLGGSFGVIEEFSKYAKPKTGFQGSVWGALFLGVDLRYRYFYDENYFAPGLFLKIPVYIKFERDKGGNMFGNLM